MLKWMASGRPAAIATLTQTLTPIGASAQQLNFPVAAVTDTAVLSAAMPELARAVIGVYRADDRVAYLDNRFRLLMVAGRYADADTAPRCFAHCGHVGAPRRRLARPIFSIRSWRARRRCNGVVGAPSMPRTSTRSARSPARGTIAQRPW